MKFSPTMKAYHLPDSGGSYISRYRSISSHINLTLYLDESIEYCSIYFTTILLDFMAYSSHIISETYRLDSLIHCVEQARRECDKQRYYLDLAKSRGRIGSIAGQQCLYQLSILCK